MLLALLSAFTVKKNDLKYLHVGIFAMDFIVTYFQNSSLQATASGSGSVIDRKTSYTYVSQKFA